MLLIATFFLRHLPLYMFLATAGPQHTEATFPQEAWHHEEAPNQNLDKQALCRKWYLEKYVIFWISYEPEKNEQNDYIELNRDMTYVSVDEGAVSRGKWAYREKEHAFILYDEGKEGVTFRIEKLTADRMVVQVALEEMDGVDIHFVTNKK